MSTKAGYVATHGKLTRAGEWFVVPRKLLRATSPAQAVVAMSILNAGRLHADEAGWVQFTPSYCTKGTGIPEDRQETIIDKLRRAKLIDVEQRHRGRHVRLNLRALERLSL